MVFPQPSRPNSLWGITFGPIKDVGILGNSRQATCTPSFLDIIFLARSGCHTPKEHSTSTSEKDCSYLANLAIEALVKDTIVCGMTVALVKMIIHCFIGPKGVFN